MSDVPKALSAPDRQMPERSSSHQKYEEFTLADLGTYLVRETNWLERANAAAMVRRSRLNLPIKLSVDDKLFIDNKVANNESLKSIMSIPDIVKNYKSYMIEEIRLSAKMNKDARAYYVNDAVGRLSLTIIRTLREGVWTFLLLAVNIISNIGTDADVDNLYRFRVRRAVTDYKQEITSELIERALDVVGAHASLRPKSKRLIEKLLIQVAAESMRLTVGKESYSEKILALPPPLRKLTETDLAAIIARGRLHPWNKRPHYRMSAFDWVAENYKEWIPGLLQSHLLLADKQLYNAFKARESRDGRPDWLDVPSENEATLRAITDPLEREERLATREAHKHRVRIQRALTSA